MQRPTNDGCLPLHIAYRHYNLDDTAIIKLLELFPIAVQHQNNKGCLPIHIACHH